MKKIVEKNSQSYAWSSLYQYGFTILYLENMTLQNLKVQWNNGLFSPFLIYVDDTQLSSQLWWNLDCISELDCTEACSKRLCLENQQNPK